MIPDLLVLIVVLSPTLSLSESESTCPFPCQSSNRTSSETIANVPSDLCRTTI